MNLDNEREFHATREKLRLLEARHEGARAESAGDNRVRELSSRSLKRLINQLKEDIVRFKARRSLTVSDK